MIERCENPTPAPDDGLLREVLEDALARHFGRPERVVGLERRPSPYRTSFGLEELTVSLEKRSPLHLMFKDLSRQSLLRAARLAKPQFLHDPEREIETYRLLLSPAQIGAPIYYGSIVDRAAGRYWLFIEKVNGKELYQIGDLSTWQQVARWLAVMHDRFASTMEPPAHPPAPGGLLKYERGLYERWMERAREFLKPTALSQDVRQRLEGVAERYGDVVERLLALPQTVIHGEFYASNVLVEQTPAGLRVCPVDWELTAWGPGLLDLAALTAGSWTEEQKRALALAYRDALSPAKGWPPDADTFLAALDCCYLHLAVQWLGWSPEWSPPPEHAQNWLAEALRRSEKLGL
jgi:aminoglycoside phosphotransferase (APT) family kinase protein